MSSTVIEKIQSSQFMTHCSQFIGIDLAPNDQLETGFSVLSRTKEIMRLDKLFRNQDILNGVLGLGEPQSMLVIIDLAKNLGYDSKFEQEQYKMHPGTNSSLDFEVGNRYGERAKILFRLFKDYQIPVCLTVSNWTRLNYEFTNPFRSRSQSGAKVLQLALQEQLLITGLPKQMVPVSVLESLLVAYTAWAYWQKPESAKLFTSKDDFPFLIGQQIVSQSRIKRFRPFRAKAIR